MAPSANPVVRLLHIRDELAWMIPFGRSTNYDAFVANVIALRAVERGLLIISEAVKTLPAEMTLRHERIPWHAIRGIGNVLRHEYATVDPQVLWLVLTIDLPALEPVVTALIAENDAG